MVRLPRNEKQTYRLNSRAQMWPSGLTLAMTLTLNFQCQIWNLLCLNQKWSDCHRTESKHIDWTPRPQMWPSGLFWPWPWPWPWICNVKYGISYISAKSGPIATKRKANISIELQASNDNLDLWNLKVKRDLDLWPHTWPMGLTLTIILTFEIWSSNVTLTFDHTHDLDHGFSWSNFEIAVSQNGRADWHCSKGAAVGHSWPWPWPFGD